MAASMQSLARFALASMVIAAGRGFLVVFAARLEMSSMEDCDALWTKQNYPVEDAEWIECSEDAPCTNEARPFCCNDIMYAGIYCHAAIEDMGGNFVDFFGRTPQQFGCHEEVEGGHLEGMKQLVEDCQQLEAERRQARAAETAEADTAKLLAAQQAYEKEDCEALWTKRNYPVEDEEWIACSDSEPCTSEERPFCCDDEIFWAGAYCHAAIEDMGGNFVDFFGRTPQQFGCKDEVEGGHLEGKKQLVEVCQQLWAELQKEKAAGMAEAGAAKLLAEQKGYEDAKAADEPAAKLVAQRQAALTHWTSYAAPVSPANFDPRQARPECLYPLFEQGECGSCWAFVQSRAIGESACVHAKHQGSLFRVWPSPEQLNSCAQTPEGALYPCSGAGPTFGIDYAAQHGLTAAHYYPYVEGSACALSETSGANEYSRFSAAGVQAGGSRKIPETLGAPSLVSVASLSAVERIDLSIGSGNLCEKQLIGNRGRQALQNMRDHEAQIKAALEHGPLMFSTQFCGKAGHDMMIEGWGTDTHGHLFYVVTDTSFCKNRASASGFTGCIYYPDHGHYVIDSFQYFRAVPIEMRYLPRGKATPVSSHSLEVLRSDAESEAAGSVKFIWQAPTSRSPNDRVVAMTWDQMLSAVRNEEDLQNLPAFNVPPGGDGAPESGTASIALDIEHASLKDLFLFYALGRTTAAGAVPAMHEVVASVKIS